MGLFRMLTQWREKDDGTLTGPALEADSATIDGVRQIPSYHQGYTVTHHSGSAVTVEGSAVEVIFDVTDPVDILYGTINGAKAGFVTVTFSDGTTDNIYNSNIEGTDRDGNGFDSKPIPKVPNVTKLEFENSLGESNTYGYEVVTR